MVIPLCDWELCALNKMEWFAGAVSLSCSPDEAGHVKEWHKGMPLSGPSSSGEASGGQVPPPGTGARHTPT